MRSMSFKRFAAPMQRLFYDVAGMTLFLCLIVLLPILPLLISLLTGNRRYLRNYYQTITKLLDTFDALREHRSLERYVQGRFAGSTPAQRKIGGSCSHCGRCCLNRRCLFLEREGEDKYFCGIFGSKLRELTSCAAYPINAQDIDLYACPSYYVIDPVAGAPAPAAARRRRAIRIVAQPASATERRVSAVAGVHGTTERRDGARM